MKMKIRSVLVDDEAKLRKVLQIKLDRHCRDVEIVGVAENANDAFKLITEVNPDLVFLDISMPGESGFQLLDRFTVVDFEVIFVTGFNNYVLNALRVSAVDYLLKPVVTEDLIQAVQKAKVKVKERARIAMYDLLKHNMNHVGDQDSKIAIPGTNSYEFVTIKDIVRCEGWQKYTKIHLASGTCLISSYNIGVFKEMLEVYDFYSVHKSHLVNTKHISRYLIDGSLVMTDHSNVPVSRRRRDVFMNDVIKVLKSS